MARSTCRKVTKIHKNGTEFWPNFPWFHTRFQTLKIFFLKNKTCKEITETEQSPGQIFVSFVLKHFLKKNVGETWQ